jgi:hypothetical protein
MASPEKTGTFVVLEERKSKHGAWDGPRIERRRFREVLDERFNTGSEAQAAAMGILKDPKRAHTHPVTYIIAELRSVVACTFDVKTSVKPYGG